MFARGRLNWSGNNFIIRFSANSISFGLWIIFEPIRSKFKQKIKSHVCVYKLLLYNSQKITNDGEWKFDCGFLIDTDFYPFEAENVE